MMFEERMIRAIFGFAGAAAFWLLLSPLMLFGTLEPAAWLVAACASLPLGAAIGYFTKPR